MQATITRIRASKLQGVTFKEGVATLEDALMADAIKYVQGCIDKGVKRSYREPSISFGSMVVVDTDKCPVSGDWLVDFENEQTGSYFACVTVTEEVA